MNPTLAHLIIISFLLSANAYAFEANDTDSILNQHFKESNLQAITHLWTMKKRDSIRIGDLTTKIGKLENENTSIINHNRELYTDNKILINENNDLKRIVRSRIPNQTIVDLDNIFLLDLINDSINNDKIDTLGLYEILRGLLEEKKRNVNSKKLYIRIDPDTIKSSFFSKNKFKVTLTEEFDSAYPAYIRYFDNELTTPYFSENPEIVIMKTERLDSEYQWEIDYLTKHWKEPFKLEMRLAGYKIKGSKVNAVVEYNNEGFLRKIINWTIWLLTRSEVIFVIIITFLANINKILEEINKIRGFFKKTKS